MTNRIKNFYLQLSLNWNIFARNLQRFKRLQWDISRTFWRFRWPWLAIWIYRFHLPTRKNLYTKNTQSHAILLLRSHIVLSMLLYQNLNYAIFSAKTYSATIDHSVRLVNSIFLKMDGMLRVSRFIYIGMKRETHIIYAAIFKRKLTFFRLVNCSTFYKLLC